MVVAIYLSIFALDTYLAAFGHPSRVGMDGPGGAIGMPVGSRRTK